MARVVGLIHKAQEPEKDPEDKKPQEPEKVSEDDKAPEDGKTDAKQAKAKR